MELKSFLIEHWLNPMDSLAKYNFGSSCTKAMTMDELFRVTGQDQDAFMKELSTMSLHYHLGDSTGSPRVKAAVVGTYPKSNITPEDVMMMIGGTGGYDIVICGLLEHDDNIVVLKLTYQQQYDIPKSLEF